MGGKVTAAYVTGNCCCGGTTCKYDIGSLGEEEELELELVGPDSGGERELDLVDKFNSLYPNLETCEIS